MKQTLNSSLSPWWVLKIISALSLVTWMVVSVLNNWRLGELVPIYLSQALVLFGSGMSLLHYRIFKRDISALQQPETLVTSGGLLPWIRHPMYLGDIFMLIGLWTFSPTLGTLIALLLGLVGIVKQAQHEDRYLASVFGLEFEQWRLHSGRLVPRLSVSK